jgi:hypothetical protein
MAFSLFVHSLVPSALTQEPQVPGGKTTPDKSMTGGSQQSAKDALASKTPEKFRKVITNGDIQSSPFTTFGGLFYTSAGSINDCDAFCFDQVRILAFQPSSEKNPHWRQEVLEQIEFVRSDSLWQSYLHQLYDAHNRICRATFDKQDEMHGSGNMRNMGPQEIAITEKYEKKIKDEQDNLAELLARQAEMQKRFADKPYANSFATLRGNRMLTGYCSKARMIYPQYY